MIRDVTEGAGPAAPCRGQTKFLLQIYIHSSVCYANNIKRMRFSDRHFYTETASDPLSIPMNYFCGFVEEPLKSVDAKPAKAFVHLKDGSIFL